MIVTQYQQRKQEQQQLQSLNGLQEKLDKQADLYGAGEFDAIIGAEADLVLTANESYRRGYHDSFWQLYLKKIQH